MSTTLSFNDVCNYIKNDQPEILDAVDKVFGVLIICLPLVFGPAMIPALSLLTVKNELTKITKNIFKKIISKEDEDFLQHQERMEIAYGYICYSAFFEALDRQIPDFIRDAIEVSQLEKELLNRESNKNSATYDKEENNVYDNPTFLSFPLPHPLGNFEEQTNHLYDLYKEFSLGFFEFLKRKYIWENIAFKQKDEIQNFITTIPDLAIKCFNAQYIELAQKYNEFFIWANFHEHKENKELIKQLSEYVQLQASISQTQNNNIDVGFSKLQKAVNSLPELFKIDQAKEIISGLQKYYEARINEQIIEDKTKYDDRPQLVFPKIKEAFIPQSYCAIRYSRKIQSLENEMVWKASKPKNNLGGFIINFLSSPYSFDTPLIILGHPGSGKSLLTKVLAAKLLSDNYPVIRIPLREVNSDLPTISQIEEQINKITGIKVSSWAHFRSQFNKNPLLIILDGYDELLQASGKVFSGYLKEVQEFQKNELEQGYPIRIIVTSRITLIDKATIPEDSVIIRLLEFNKFQREKWISIWNNSNKHYFANSTQKKIEPFELPTEADLNGKNILSLAEQPLLLLMLALYDSEDNKLRKSKNLDRTTLYHNLISQFIDRERSKKKEFVGLKEIDRLKAIDLDIERLGAVSIGMYNRRKLHIIPNELNEDLKYFSLEKEIIIEDGKPLSQADMVLGSFFFVHKSKSSIGDDLDQHEENSAFEFLHNTFGEFLTADFILRQTIRETESLRAMGQNDNLSSLLIRNLDRPDSFSKSWTTCFSFTPLFSRPVIVEMLREWLHHYLSKNKVSKAEFLKTLDTIISNEIKKVLYKQEMSPIFHGYEKTPFGTVPLIGHIAIYSINLLIIRAIFSDKEYVFNEDLINSSKDGTRTWTQLLNIWKSWFSVENLNSLTGIVIITREKNLLHIKAKELFGITNTVDRLDLLFNVSKSLCDNVTMALTGIVRLQRDGNIENLKEISECLNFEGINLKLLVKINELLYSQEKIINISIENIIEIFLDTLISGNLEEVILLSSILKRLKLRGVINQIIIPKKYHSFIIDRIFEVFQNNYLMSIELCNLFIENKLFEEIMTNNEFLYPYLHSLLINSENIETAISLLSSINEVAYTPFLEQTRSIDRIEKAVFSILFSTPLINDFLLNKHHLALKLLLLIINKKYFHNWVESNKFNWQDRLDQLLCPRIIRELLLLNPLDYIVNLYRINQHILNENINRKIQEIIIHEISNDFEDLPLSVIIELNNISKRDRNSEINSLLRNKYYSITID